jgi:hypothetical protein
VDRVAALEEPAARPMPPEQAPGADDDHAVLFQPLPELEDDEELDAVPVAHGQDRDPAVHAGR